MPKYSLCEQVCCQLSIKRGQFMAEKKKNRSSIVSNIHMYHIWHIQTDIQLNCALPITLDTAEKIYPWSMYLKLSLGVGKSKCNNNSLNNKAPRLCSKRHSSILFINFVSIRLVKTRYKTIPTSKRQQVVNKNTQWNMQRLRNVKYFQCCVVK